MKSPRPNNQHHPEKASVSLKLPKELYDKCKALAERDDRTISGFIQKTIREKTQAAS